MLNGKCIRGNIKLTVSIFLIWFGNITPNQICRAESGLSKDAVTDNSCINRCHVNYASYVHKFKGSQNNKNEEIFRHNVHMPSQGIECMLCHDQSPEGSERHGRLLIDENNCFRCHHDLEQKVSCEGCHSILFDFFKGKSGISGISILPDKMSRVVGCKDCHKYIENDYHFKDVKDRCIECHNASYGELYEAMKGFLEKAQGQISDKSAIMPLQSRPLPFAKDGLAVFPFNKGESGEISLQIVEKCGIHNFELSREIIKRFKNDYSK